MRRTTNQDSHALVVADTAELWQARGHFLMVADGMGAHAAGELASKIAADGIPHLYHKHRDLSPPEALEKAIRETNAEVHRRGMANPDFPQHGDHLQRPRPFAAGGSRRPHRRQPHLSSSGNQLHQLTFDHSLQWNCGRLDSFRQGATSRFGAQERHHPLARRMRTWQIDLEGPCRLSWRRLSAVH